VIAPGSTIGILGGGQLGRMLAMAAAQLGYRVHVLAPEDELPAGDVAAQVTRADYADRGAIDAFAATVDVATFEFENIDVAAIRYLAGLVPVFPPAAALKVSQDRVAEKRFVAALGGTTAPYRAVDSLADLEAAVLALGCPAVLKTRRMGYDGKGQARLHTAGDCAAAWAATGGATAVLEGFVRFDTEFSVILARGVAGQAVYALPENRHVDGILDSSHVPAAGGIAAQADAAIALARAVADALDYRGVLTCEFFATADGPVFNEMAPRVHNSGHWTIEGATTSQFENHIRAICGLPLGSPALVTGAARMKNLLGDDVDAWGAFLADPTAHLHLYGKREVVPDRKMGHVTWLA